MRALALTFVALLTAGFSGDGGLDARLTPPGRATLWSVWTGAHTLEGPHAEVLTAVQITVGRGGKAGRVRLRVIPGVEDERQRSVRVGPWFTLPATPGKYTFRVPRVPWDY